MQPETKYAKSGDLHIAYQVIGDGPVDLVVSPGFISHLDLNWTQPAFPRYVRRLASFARVILFDKRGTGLSDPTPGAVPIDERMDDIRAVMDAVGSERAALFGYSEGGPMSILFAATYPERTHALVLYGTYAHNAAMPDERWEQVANAIDHWGEGIIARLFVPSFPDNALNRKGAGVYERAAASPAMARALIEGAAHIDVRSALSAVQAPTLVIHRRGEFMPVEAARELAAGIPQARYIELPGTDHLPWVGDMDAILDPVEEFLTGAKHRADPDRVLATVLFTDIVEGTARAASIGDDQWRETLERHNTLVRRAISEHRGVEVKTTGDGFLATFDGPARAIRSALEIVEGVRELGLEVRAGLHTGECERIDDDDIGGTTVNIAARVMALAGPGDVLVSGTLRDLVIGSGIEFVDRGAHSLRGIPGEWRVFAVRAGETQEVGVPPVELMNASDRAIMRLGQRAPRAARALARLSGWAGPRGRKPTT